MLAIFNSLNAHNLPILQMILMILVSKFMVHRALSEKAYLSLGLLSPLKFNFFFINSFKNIRLSNTFGFRSDPTSCQVLTWVQTVCKGY